VSVWSLTDHDTVAGQEGAAAAAREQGLRFVPGIELSVFLGDEGEGREVHVLGHFVDPAHPSLRRFEDLLADHRRGRMGRILERLGKLGIRVTLEEVVACSGGKTLGRPHVARAVVAAGAAPSVREAFDRWLGEGRPAYVGRYRLSAADAVALVRGAGGVATLAHPGVSRVGRVDLAELRRIGFEGVEVRHPEHSPGQVEEYRRLARELGLVPTAGSDFHGPAINPERVIGSAGMAPEDLAALEARRP
jgi:hypothetical protein